MPFNNRTTIIRWDTFTQHEALKTSKLPSFEYDFNYTLKSSFLYTKKDPNISIVEACPIWIQASCHSNWKYRGVRWQQIEIWWIPLFLFVSNSSLHAHIWSSFKMISSFFMRSSSSFRRKSKHYTVAHHSIFRSLILSHVWSLVPTFVL
jgi:hypothetical protein